MSKNRIPAILSLTPSRRALGIALTDNVELIDSDVVHLHEHKDNAKALNAVRSYLIRILQKVRPELIIIEDIDKKRRDIFNSAVITIIQTLAEANELSQPIFAKRRDAVMHHTKCWRRNIRECLRELSTRFARTCPKLAFTKPTTSPLRSEWDRTWGQAVAACAIASYARHHYF